MSENSILSTTMSVDLKEIQIKNHTSHRINNQGLTNTIVIDTTKIDNYGGNLYSLELLFSGTVTDDIYEISELEFFSSLSEAEKKFDLSVPKDITTVATTKVPIQKKDVHQYWK